MDSSAQERDAAGGPAGWRVAALGRGEGAVVADETALPAGPGEASRLGETEQPAGLRPKRRFGRRRANAAGGRSHAHQVKVTPEEEARLVGLAAAQRVTVSRLLLESALAARGETPTQRREAMVELLAIRRLLAAVSNNVNQIARSANAREEFPADAAGVLVGVRRVVGRIDDTLDRLSKP